jgi:hypothetical protein
MNKSLLCVSLTLIALGSRQALAGEPLAATIGTPQNSKWTDTTTAAAGTPAQTKQLGKGKPFTVEGEIIDISCFVQLGKRGEKHIPCGTKCLQHGQPVGIVDDKGNVYTLFVEQHDPRRDGKVDLNAAFIPLLAKRVKISGMLNEDHNAKGLYIDASALPAAPAEAPAAAPPAP